MSRQSEIQAAWEDFEKAANTDRGHAWSAVRQALAGQPERMDEVGHALLYLRDLATGGVAFTVKDGWYGCLTLNGIESRFGLGVLMEGDRAVGIRRIATDETGGKLLGPRGPMVEDVYGDVGGWLTQDYSAATKCGDAGEIPAGSTVFGDRK